MSGSVSFTGLLKPVMAWGGASQFETGFTSMGMCSPLNAEVIVHMT